MGAEKSVGSSRLRVSPEAFAALTAVAIAEATLIVLAIIFA